MENEKVKKQKPKRYQLVIRNPYEKKYLIPSGVEVGKDGKMNLSTIDGIMTGYKDEESFLKASGFYNPLVKTDVLIIYKAEGTIKRVPVIYNDPLLQEIALNSTTEVWDSPKTRRLYTKMQFPILAKETGVMKRLIDGKYALTDPKITGMMMYAYTHGADKLDMGKVGKRLFKNYKQYRTVYYNTKEYL